MMAGSILKDKAAVIFDMDNTLLSSRIDFGQMKKDLYRYLSGKGLMGDKMDLTGQTCATLIEYAKERGLSAEAEREIWDIVEEHEFRGMEGAVLEPGVPEMLEAAKGRYFLTVLTNNSRDSAVRALERNGISHFFQLIAGREQMTALKPSPSGVRFVLDRFAQIPPSRWVLIGDSWIDGKAARDAGVTFVVYGRKKAELIAQGIVPAGEIACFDANTLIDGGVCRE